MNQPVSDPSMPGPGRTLDTPVSGHELDRGIRLFHDAEGGNFQVHTGSGGAVRIQVGAFDGSYLSLAVPLEDLDALIRHRHVRLDLMAVASRPITVFQRFNLSGRRDRKDLHDAIVVHEGARTVAFDLRAFDLEAIELNGAWLDVIFARPQEIEIDIASLTLSCDGPS